MSPMYDVLVQLLDPFLLLMLALGVSILSTLQFRRHLPTTTGWLARTYLALYIACMPAAVHLALGSLEWQFDWQENLPQQRQAIVVLGGYLMPYAMSADERLADDTLYRCLTAAKLYQRGDPCPVLLSGGKVDETLAGPSLAEAMESFLRQHGLEQAEMLLETRSRNTYENAVETARLLKERNIDEVILVTDAYHMYRAERCFQAQGIQVIPCGSRRRTPGFEISAWAFLPSSRAAEDLSRVAHEWLGVAWYWLNGRI